MELNELRVGNLILNRKGETIRLDYWHSRLKIAEERRRDGLTLPPKVEFASKLKPITLTEEWWCEMGKNKIIKPGLEISFEWEFNCVKMFINDSFLKRIDFLHQMQNIWFDLTNEELKINNHD